MRDEIDAIDAQMIDLFVKRMEISARVGRYKAETGMKVLDRTREDAVLSRVAERAGEELAGYARALYETLLEQSRAYQAFGMGVEG